jgi:hypothetical protein
MRALRSFFSFWYDFIVGDDLTVAVGVVIALTMTALLAHAGLPAWWLMPAAVLTLLAGSLARAARRR